nr:hypothetical protein [Enterobacter cloacae complex sp.]
MSPFMAENTATQFIGDVKITRYDTSILAEKINGYLHFFKIKQ